MPKRRAPMNFERVLVAQLLPTRSEASGILQKRGLSPLGMNGPPLGSANFLANPRTGNKSDFLWVT